MKKKEINRGTIATAAFTILTTGKG